ncbi:MAG: glycoside hydrolase family 3 N-terminal domain-containing protein [Chloroflexota bacterium]
MSFVRIVRLIICITFLFNFLVPQKFLLGQSENLTPVLTPTPQSEPSPNVTPSPPTPELLEEIITSLAAQYLEQSLEVYIEQYIEQYIAQMSVADKIGQLFIVAFEGNDVSPTSDISNLIHTFRIGGVVISPRNRNFDNSRSAQEDAVTQVTRLTNQLQALSYGKEWDAEFDVQSEAFTSTVSSWVRAPITSSAIISASTSFNPPTLPLFIAVEQAGDGLSREGLPDTALRLGFTELPSPLALGATWDPELTQEVGKIVGQELEAVGVNMLLGPYLDVVREAPTGSVSSLGVYSFGGDPEWVGKMGRAYIKGVHEGGSGRVITIARQFPGEGDSDRLPYEEIATIQSTIEELRRYNFPPFLAAMTDRSGIATDEAVTDGMMSSHMYFSALQGDFEPFSAFRDLQDEIEPPPEASAKELWSRKNEFWRPTYEVWRASGLMMTSGLDTPAIRRIYKEPDRDFTFVSPASEAFDAGHDLLYLSHFSSEDSWEVQKQNIKDVVTYFQRRYETREGFSDSVEQSVYRILRAKLRMYHIDDAIAEQLNEVVRQIIRANLQLYIADSTQIGQNDDNEEPPGSQPIIVESSVPITASISPITTTDFIVSSSLVTEVVKSTQISNTLSFSIPLESVLIAKNPYLTLANDVKAASRETIRQVAAKSITLILPDPTGETDPLPESPKDTKKLLIITDNALYNECKQCISEDSECKKNRCTPENLVAPEEIQNIILRLYGDEGDQLIRAEIKSVTFEDLEKFLDAAEEEATASESEPVATIQPDSGPPPSEIDAVTVNQEVTPTAEAEADAVTEELKNPSLRVKPEDLEGEGWIIFAMLDIVEERPGSDVIKRFLREQNEQLSDKNVVVFALNAPYFLDGTEASRLDLYLGVNSKIGPFLDVAVRTLFKDGSFANPQGNAPVNVPGTRYSNLSLRLLPYYPNPELLPVPIQVFVGDELIAERPSEDIESNGIVTISSDEALSVRVYDIRDRNDNIVKDTTQIEFEILHGDENSSIRLDPVPSVGGSTERIMIPRERLPAPGLSFSIAAYSDVDSEDGISRARISSIDLVIEGEEVSESTSAETEEATATPTPEPIAEPTAVPPTPAEPGQDDTALEDKPHVDWFTFLMSLVTIVGMISVLVIPQLRITPRQYIVRYMLWAMIVGLAVYVLYGLFLPVEIGQRGYPWAPPLFVFTFMLIPLLWLQLRNEA